MSQEELHILEDRLRSYVDSFKEYTNEALSILEKSIESLEQQFATLSIGMIEQSVMVEALITMIPKDRLEEYTSYVAKRRKEIFTNLQETGNIVLAGESESVAGTMETTPAQD